MDEAAFFAKRLELQATNSSLNRIQQALDGLNERLNNVISRVMVATGVIFTIWGGILTYQKTMSGYIPGMVIMTDMVIFIALMSVFIAWGFGETLKNDIRELIEEGRKGEKWIAENFGLHAKLFEKMHDPSQTPGKLDRLQQVLVITALFWILLDVAVHYVIPVAF